MKIEAVRLPFSSHCQTLCGDSATLKTRSEVRIHSPLLTLEDVEAKTSKRIQMSKW